MPGFLKKSHETGKPIFVTENGKNDAVIMSMETYDELVGVNAAHEKILQGIEQADKGEIISYDKVTVAAKKLLD